MTFTLNPETIGFSVDYSREAAGRYRLLFPGGETVPGSWHSKTEDEAWEYLPDLTTHDAVHAWVLPAIKRSNLEQAFINALEEELSASVGANAWLDPWTWLDIPAPVLLQAARRVLIIKAPQEAGEGENP